MELRVGDPVAGRDTLLGILRAFSVARSRWQLNAVLVEPEHRLGMGRWMSIADFAVTPDGRDFTVKLDPATFARLPAGESTEIVEGVATGIPFRPSPPVLRQVAKQIAQRGSIVLDESTPVHREDDEYGRLAGLVSDPDGEIRSVLVARSRLLRTSEETLPTTGLSLEERGIRVSLSLLGSDGKRTPRDV